MQRPAAWPVRLLRSVTPPHRSMLAVRPLDSRLALETEGGCRMGAAPADTSRTGVPARPSMYSDCWWRGSAGCRASLPRRRVTAGRPRSCPGGYAGAQQPPRVLCALPPLEPMRQTLRQTVLARGVPLLVVRGAAETVAYNCSANATHSAHSGGVAACMLHTAQPCMCCQCCMVEPAFNNVLVPTHLPHVPRIV